MKQTEIGLIPDDWEVRALGEVADTFTGLTYSPENIYEHGTLVLRSSNIKNGQLCFEDNVYVQMPIPERAIVKENDILICVRNGSKTLIGKSSLITKNAVGMAFGAFMTVLRSKTINQKYLLYVWQSDLVQKQVSDNLGATINQITNSDFKKFNIVISPDQNEQQRIAKTLSDVDTLISTTEKLIQKKKNIKQGTMQNLLTGKKRLPGFAKSTNYKQTELGPIPEDWEVKSLGDIAFVTKLAGFEFTAHVNYSEIGKIIALRGLNVKNGYLVLDDVKFIDNSNFSKLDRSKLYINDLLFTYVGTVGNVALVNKNDTYYLAPNVALIRGNKYVYSYFLMYLMLSQHFFDNQIQALMSTTSQAALSMTNIRLFKIPLPSIEEQTAIANVLSSMDKEIETLNTKLEKYRNLKTAMMQQLLTGKIRLV